MRSSHRAARWMVVLALTLGSAPAVPEGPDPDAALNALVRLDPALLAKRLDALRVEAASRAEQAAESAARGDRLASEADAIEEQLALLESRVAALSALLLPAPAGGEMMAAQEEELAPLVNFAEHVQPILDRHCAQCHNADRRRGGLALALHGQILEGGSSGSVLTPGDPDGSRLLRVVTHDEEPVMPPSGDKIPEEEIAVLRQWIADGAPATADDRPMAARQDSAPQEETPVFVAAAFADTPALPEIELMPAAFGDGRAEVVRAADTSPSAPLLAVGGRGQVALYHLEERRWLGALPFDEGIVYTLTFSRNGELLLAGGGHEGSRGRAVLYEVRTGQALGVYGSYFDAVTAADISPDHRMIALGGPNERVRAYAMGSGEELYLIDEHSDWIQAVRFTPDGEVLATADRGGGLYLWQAANGRAVEQLRGHDGAINALEYTADSVYLASAGQDGTVQIWDTWEYRRVRSIRAHDGPVLNLDVCPENRILSVSTDRSAALWNIEGQAIGTLPGLDDWSYQARFALEGSKALAGSWSGAIHVWDLTAGEVDGPAFAILPGATPDRDSIAAR